MKKCPFCQEEIQDTAIKCRYCGEWLQNKESESNVNISHEEFSTPIESSLQKDEGTLPPLEKQNVNTARLYAAYLGDTNRDYYLSKFQDFDQKISALKASWNWAACFGPAWALYRKMYGWFFALWIISMFVSSGIETTQGVIIVHIIVSLMLTALFATYANSLYHNNIKKKIAAAQLTIKDEAQLLNYLRTKGGVNTWVIYASIGLILSSILVFLVLIMLLGKHEQISKESILIMLAIPIAIGVIMWVIYNIQKQKKDVDLSPDVKPQKKSSHQEYTLAKEERKAATAKVVIAIILVVAIAVVFLFLNDIRSNSPNQTQNNYTVTETQATPQALTAEEWVEKAKALSVDGEFTDPQKAIEYLNNAIKLEPGFTGAYVERGDAYVGLGQYQRAIEDYNEAIRLKPDDSYAYFFRGFACAGLGQHQQAIENYSEAIRLGRNDAISYSSRGKSHNAMKQYEQAIADLNKAIQLDPNFPGSYRHRGNTYRNLGQYQQAIKDFNEAIRLKADYVKAYNDRGQVYLSRNNKHLGCNDAQKACDLGNCELLEVSKNSGVCH